MRGTYKDFCKHQYVRLGQTSVIHFGSKIVSSVAGFLVTFYVAVELGSGVLGQYAVFLAVVLWGKVLIGGGINQAIIKRLSERTGDAGDLIAGVVSQAGIFGVALFVLWLFRASVSAFLGIASIHVLVLGLTAILGFGVVKAGLHGLQKVHIASLLEPLDRVVRSSIQLLVVFVGLLGGGLAGLIWGYIAGVSVAMASGLVFLRLRPARPKLENFRRILSFTRYSWISSIEGRAFSAMDTIILGLVVAPNLIGYYEVAWNLASIVAVFGASVSETLFPAISEHDSTNQTEVVADRVNDALTFAGLFLIPGFVGVLVIGEHVLSIYGSEFRQAGLVLVLLTAARLFYVYKLQFNTTLNAINRPEVAFRVNLVFIVSNLVLNSALVLEYGWIGAAVGTLISAMLSLVLAYHSVGSVIDIELPIGELLRQWAAAFTMGGVVYVTEFSLLGPRSPTIAEAILLVGVGAGTYLLALGSISTRFRTTVRDNLQLT